MHLDDWIALGYPVYELDDFTECQNNPPEQDEDGEWFGCEELWCPRCDRHASDCPCMTLQAIDDLTEDDLEWVNELRAEIEQQQRGN